MELPIHDPKLMSKRETWKKHLEHQAVSGLTQAAYCQREGLKVTTFQYWKRRLAGEPVRAKQLRFVPLELATLSSQSEVMAEAEATSWEAAVSSQAEIAAEADVPSWIRLHVNELVLEFPETISIPRLQKLVAGLREGAAHVAH